MIQKICITTALVQLSLLANLASAMEPKPSKKYTTTIEDATKALIVIEAINLMDLAQHLKIKPSFSGKLKIKARVAPEDVELQEKQYTETPFLPFFLDQSAETVIIKPHVPGIYTVHIPQNSYFTASTPQGTIKVDESIMAFDTTKTLQ